MANSRPNRVRSRKIQLWMRPGLVDEVDRISEDRGYSRDGAFERAVNLFIKHEETPHADRS